MKKIFSVLLCLLCLQSVFAYDIREKNSYDVQLKNGLNMNVAVCSDGIFRIRISPLDEWKESLMERYGIIKTNWSSISVKQNDTNKLFTLSTDNYQLKIDKKTGYLTVLDKKGQVIIERVAFVTSKDPLCENLGNVINKKFENLKVPRNSGIIGDTSKQGGLRDMAETGDYNNTSIINISLKEGERFYGGGSTSREHIQHRGELLRMWTTYQHTEIPMPMMISSNNWGVYNNTTRKSFFDIGHFQTDIFSIYNTSTEADFYLMFGNSMPDIINAFTEITGRPYVLPRWAYGLCFGPNMLENQFDILNDAINFRREKVPCDLIWFEPQWMEKKYDFSTKKKWNYKTFTAEPYWDSIKYPKKEHHRLLIGRLHKLGFHVGLWLCEEYDLSLPEEDILAQKLGKKTSGQEHWMDHLTHFMDNGVDGFKLDPARTIDEHPNREYYNGHSDKEMHNLNQILLPKQMNLMSRQHTGKRSWHHYTAGWAGTQHWGASTSGDNGGGRTALFDQLNLGMSGFMNTSCDVMSVPSDTLEMPSLHFGLFLPWVQINSWYALCQPFYFPEKEKNIYKYYVQLRYNLLPYIYSAALEGGQTGMPIVRSMPLMFPEDRKCDDMVYQYMFGENLLLSIFSNNIYLPKGNWFDFWSGEKFTGGRQISHTFPDNRAGLIFVREGAIIPMQQEMQYNGEKSLDTLNLKIYPKRGGLSTYTMYEDDGSTYAYEDGKISETCFECTEKNGNIHFMIKPVKGAYEGMYTSRVYNLEINTNHKPEKVLINNQSSSKWTYGTDNIVRVQIKQNNTKQKVMVSLQ